MSIEVVSKKTTTIPGKELWAMIRERYPIPKEGSSPKFIGRRPKRVSNVAIHLDQTDAACISWEESEVMEIEPIATPGPLPTERDSEAPY